MALIGPNGAGKTTTLRSIAGLWSLLRGTIVFCGSRVHSRPPNEIVKQGLALVSEGRRLFRSMTVQENLNLAPPRLGLERTVDRPWMTSQHCSRSSASDGVSVPAP